MSFQTSEMLRADHFHSATPALKSGCPIRIVRVSVVQTHNRAAPDVPITLFRSAIRLTKAAQQRKNREGNKAGSATEALATGEVDGVSIPTGAKEQLHKSGSRVEAQWKEGDHWFLAEVVAFDRNTRLYKLKYLNCGESWDKVPQDFIRPAPARIRKHKWVWLTYYDAREDQVARSRGSTTIGRFDSVKAGSAQSCRLLLENPALKRVWEYPAARYGIDQLFLDERSAAQLGFTCRLMAYLVTTSSSVGITRQRSVDTSVMTFGGRNIDSKTHDFATIGGRNNNEVRAVMNPDVPIVSRRSSSEPWTPAPAQYPLAPWPTMEQGRLVEGEIFLPKEWNRLPSIRAVKVGDMMDDSFILRPDADMEPDQGVPDLAMAALGSEGTVSNPLSRYSQNKSQWQEHVDQLGVARTATKGYVDGWDVMSLVLHKAIHNVPDDQKAIVSPVSIKTIFYSPTPHRTLARVATNLKRLLATERLSQILDGSANDFDDQSDDSTVVNPIFFSFGVSRWQDSQVKKLQGQRRQIRRVAMNTRNMQSSTHKAVTALAVLEKDTSQNARLTEEANFLMAKLTWGQLNFSGSSNSDTLGIDWRSKRRGKKEHNLVMALRRARQLFARGQGGICHVGDPSLTFSALSHVLEVLSAPAETNQRKTAASGAKKQVSRQTLLGLPPMPVAHAVRAVLEQRKKATPPEPMIELTLFGDNASMDTEKDNVERWVEDWHCAIEELLDHFCADALPEALVESRLTPIYQVGHCFGSTPLP